MKEGPVHELKGQVQLAICPEALQKRHQIWMVQGLQDL